jgi:hypothetical protein
MGKFQMAAFHTMAAGCGGIVHRGLLGPTSCDAEPVYAGLWYAAHSRTVWLGFACYRDVNQLIACGCREPCQLMRQHVLVDDSAEPVSSERPDGCYGVMFLPHYPLWAIVTIALDVAIIWALAVYREDAA